MNQTSFSVLIVDDHPLIVDAYKSALNSASKKSGNLSFKVEVADNCDMAIDFVNQAIDKNKIDIVFLDIKLPPSQDGKFLSGEDIGIKIREVLPDTLIIILTTYNDNYRIYNILKNIDPDGFMIKDDITPDELVKAIFKIIKSPPFYSTTVIKLMRKQFSNDFVIDGIDRRLLYELSIGSKIKDLPDIIPLSLAGIEKRRRRLKEIFGTKTSSDRELILVAKEKGFI